MLPLRDQKNKKRFMSIIRGKSQEDHKVLINERFFNLNNLNRWRLYLKLILQYINYLHEIEQRDLASFLEEIIKEVNAESFKFKRKMNYEIGGGSNDSIKI